MARYTPDATIAELEVSNPITGSFTNNGGTGSTEAIAAGNYTPTVAGNTSTNVTSSSASTFHWQRIGDKVFVTGKVSVTPTASTTLTVFDLTLPVASDFSGDNDDLSAHGAADVAGEVISCVGWADSSDDVAVIRFYSVSTGAHVFRLSFMYTIE